MVYIPYKIIPIGFAIFAVVAQYIRVRSYMDYGKTVGNHRPGDCHLVPGIEHGAEDMVVLPNGLAIITSGAVDYSNQHLSCFEGVKGQVFVFDMNQPRSRAEPITIQGFSTEGFNPLSISFYRHEYSPNKYTIMITNPQYTGDTVEQFILDTAASPLVLQHVNTVSSTEFGRLHGIAAINEEDFYVTNAWYSTSRLGLLIEKFCWVKWGLVHLYEGGKMKIVVRDLFFATGIALSPDKKYVYVTESLPGKFRIYSRRMKGRLIKSEVYKLESSPNHMGVSSGSDEVFIGSHPVTWSMLQHAVDIHQPTPSHVLRLTVRDGHVTSMKEVFADSGHMLWGSSVAHRHKDRGRRVDGMVIGTIHHKMAYCNIDTPFEN